MNRDNNRVENSMGQITIIYKTLLLVILLIITFIVGNIYTLLDNKINFYEHNNKKINLLQVKKISSRVSYYATLSSDTYSDINKHYNTTLSEAEMTNIEKILRLATKSEFYNMQFTAYLNLDDELIKLYQSPRYLKLPKKYTVNLDMLATLRRYGIDNFQYKSLQKLEVKTYVNKNKFIDDVITYGRLKRNAWSEKNIPLLGLGKNAQRFMETIEENEKENIMKEEDIEKLMLELHRAYNEYLGIK